jgi:hypothetical protein
VGDDGSGRLAAGGDGDADWHAPTSAITMSRDASLRLATGNGLLLKSDRPIDDRRQAQRGTGSRCHGRGRCRLPASSRSNSSIITPRGSPRCRRRIGGIGLYAHRGTARSLPRIRTPGSSGRSRNGIGVGVAGVSGRPSRSGRGPDSARTHGPQLRPAARSWLISCIARTRHMSWARSASIGRLAYRSMWCHAGGHGLSRICG